MSSILFSEDFSHLWLVQAWAGRLLPLKAYAITHALQIIGAALASPLPTPMGTIYVLAPLIASKICLITYVSEAATTIVQCVFNKKETGTNMPISPKLHKHLNNLGYYLLEGYLPFQRYVGSITSVNEREHFNKRLTIDFVPNPLNLAFTNVL